MKIIGPQPGQKLACESILRSLPDWFGIESAIIEYVQRVPALSTFHAIIDGDPVGLLSIERHFDTAAEVYLMAIRPEHHRRGMGRALLQAAESWLRSEGVRFLQVKTLGPSRPDLAYDQTRQFYRAVGFEPLEEIPTLWDERIPCLIMIRALR